MVLELLSLLPLLAFVVVTTELEPIILPAKRCYPGATWPAKLVYLNGPAAIFCGHIFPYCFRLTDSVKRPGDEREPFESIWRGHTREPEQNKEPDETRPAFEGGRGRLGKNLS